MGDVTITESQYNKMVKAEALVKAEAKLEHEEGGRGGLMGWVDSKKGWLESKKEKSPVAYGFAKVALQAAGIGAVAYYLATSDMVNKIAWFRDNWWAKALAVMAIGLVLLQRKSSLAAAVLSAGAAMFVQAYRARPEDKTAARGDAGAKKDVTTSGPDDDAGRWDWSDDTYGRRGRWAETPHGGRSYMTEGRGATAAERIAERVFEHARPA